jgi:hypothetical protein
VGATFRHPPRPDLQPTDLLYHGYRATLAGIKRPGRDVDDPAVNDSVELNQYFLSRASRPVLRDI